MRALTLHRRAVTLSTVVAAILAAATVGPLVLAAPAEATSYRFWTYWGVAPDSTSWQFAQSGADRRPGDRSVEGWRFAVSPSTRAAPAPRVEARGAFDEACGSTSEQTGKKRVALYVDFGTAGDAPRGSSRPGTIHRSCVVADPGTTGLQLLAAAGFTDIRLNGGMVCGISGYPTTGCGDAVADRPTRPAPKKPRAEPGSKAQGDADRTRPTVPAGRASKRSGGSGGSTTAPPSGAAAAGAVTPTADASPRTTGSDTATGTATDGGPRGTAGPATGPAAATGDATGAPGGAAEDDGNGEDVAVVEGPPTSTSDGSGAPWVLALVVLVAAALAGGALRKARRSR